MQSLLERSDGASIATEPFPHLVLPNALSESLYTQLASEYPSIDVIAGGRRWGSNARYSLIAAKALEHLSISAAWRDFVRAHITQEFFDRAMQLFGDHIRAIYPEFEREHGKLSDLKCGLRQRDNFDSVDVLLDAQISINTPVTGRPSAVRGLHVDHPNKILVGLFYMRDPADTSDGGDLELGRFRGPPGGFESAELDGRHVEIVKTVRYDRNLLVMFPNSLHALHGVTVRAKTVTPRYLFNLVAEVRAPLFRLDEYQQHSRGMADLIARSVKKMRSSSLVARVVARSGDVR